MRKFSDELVEDREFEIGGELFKWRYPYWEEYAARREEDARTVAKANEPKKDGEDDEDEITFNELYADFIKRIETFIDPENDAVNRWRRLAKRKIDPVPAYQFTELYFWLLEVTSSRPTEQPSPSENGQGQTAITSKAASS